MKVTVRKIAELAKVSRGTVDRVIHERPGVSETVQKRIQGIIEVMNYTPNLAGKALVSQNRNIEIGVVLAQDFHPFIGELRAGIDEEARNIMAFGVKTDIEVVNSLDAAEQLMILDRFEEQNVAGLAIFPIDDELVRRKIRHLTDKGIPIVTFNSDIKNSGRIGFVGQDNEKAGRTAYGLMENILPQGSKIAIIISTMNLDCHRRRLEGFRKRMEESGTKLELVKVDENNDEDSKALEIAIDYGERFPDLKGVYLTGGGAGGFGNGLKIAGLDKLVKVVSHDRVPSVIKLMNEGIIKFTICQNPREQGAMPIRMLFDYIFKKKVPEIEMNYTGIDILTIDNL